MYKSALVKEIEPKCSKWAKKEGNRPLFELVFSFWTTYSSETLLVTLVQEIEIYWLVGVIFLYSNLIISKQIVTFLIFELRKIHRHQRVPWANLRLVA